MGVGKDEENGILGWVFKKSSLLHDGRKDGARTRTLITLFLQEPK